MSNKNFKSSQIANNNVNCGDEIAKILSIDNIKLLRYSHLNNNIILNNITNDMMVSYNYTGTPVYVLDSNIFNIFDKKSKKSLFRYINKKMNNENIYDGMYVLRKNDRPLLIITDVIKFNNENVLTKMTIEDKLKNITIPNILVIDIIINDLQPLKNTKSLLSNYNAKNNMNLVKNGLCFYPKYSGNKLIYIPNDCEIKLTSESNESDKSAKEEDERVRDFDDLENIETVAIAIKCTNPDTYIVNIDNIDNGYLYIKNIDDSIKLYEHFKKHVNAKILCVYNTKFSSWEFKSFFN